VSARGLAKLKTMSIFNEEIKDRDNKPSPWVKAEELFSGKEFIIQSVDIVEANNYGAEEGDSLFDKGILQDGETIRYSFTDKDGNERKYDSKSAGLYFAFKQTNPEPGKIVSITRTGKGDQTRYKIEIK